MLLHTKRAHICTSPQHFFCWPATPGSIWLQLLCNSTNQDKSIPARWQFHAQWRIASVCAWNHHRFQESTFHICLQLLHTCTCTHQHTSHSEHFAKIAGWCKIHRRRGRFWERGDARATPPKRNIAELQYSLCNNGGYMLPKQSWVTVAYSLTPIAA